MQGDNDLPIEARSTIPSWSRDDDHEDGGPNIQLPAAESRYTLRLTCCDHYTRRLAADILPNLSLVVM